MALAFGHERDPDRAAAWLAETGRLLLDLPGEILGSSIDEAIKRSDRGFMPAVGQIRAIAEPMLADREREARRLDALVRMIDAGAQPPQRRRPEPTPEFDPGSRCTAEEAAAVIDELGLRSAAKAKRVLHDGPASRPTEADYIAIMGEAAWRASQASRAEGGGS